VCGNACLAKTQSGGFQVPNTWKEIGQVMPHVSRMLLYGPPGTGKTTLGFCDDRETFYVPLHEETSPAELIGHFVPVGTRFVWFDGPVLLAWQRGARLILDELDQAGGSVMSVLRAILNDPSVARLTLPDPSLAEMDDDTLAAVIASGDGFRTVKPHEGFQVLATMNGDPEDLDAPLLDRFEATFYVSDTNPDAINALPEDLRVAAKRTAVGDDDRRIGLRRWKAFATLREKVGEDVAGRAVFGSRHGDIVDALRLARGESTSHDKSGDEKPAESPVSAESVSDTGDKPTIYLIRTGRRGRPPIAECPDHGKLTHRSGIVDDAGNLNCKRCGHRVASKGGFIRRVKTGDKWVSQEM
jgi:DNA polymerase III delta prime subunit